MDALGRYCEYMGKIGAETEAPAVVQLEAKLSELARGPLAAAFTDLADSPTLYDILLLPKPSLSALWLEAFEQCLDESVRLREAGKDVIMTFHAIWYHHRNREYFSAVNFERLGREDAASEAVVTLIDDIFDVLVRLSVEGGVFAPLHFPSLLVDRTEKLLRILDWRAHEQLLSEKIAEVTSDGSHFLLAVKHPFQTLRQLLAEPSSTRIYLSHPISLPRAMLSSVDGEVEAKTEIAAIQGMAAQLRDCAIVFEPTAIDEYRFKSFKGNTLPLLESRWPKAASDDALLCSPVDTTNEFGSELSAVAQKALGGDEAALQELHEAGPLLDILSDGISRHINLRDHKLVDQSDFLVAYRPYYKGRSASGVAEELTYYAALKALDVKREACIVLHPPDDDAMRPIIAAQEFVRGNASGALDEAKLQEASLTRTEELVSANDLVVGRALRTIARGSGSDLPTSTSVSALRADPASQIQQQDRMYGRDFKETIVNYINRLPEGTANVIEDDLTAQLFAVRVCEILAQEGKRV